MEKQWKQCQTLFWGAPKSLQMVTAAMKLKDVYSLEEKLWPTYKGLSSQSYGFSSSHVWMWELDHKESWAPKNWCLWTMVLEKTLESPLTARRSNQFIVKEISPEFSLEGPMLKLKLQYFVHLMWKANSLALMKRHWCWERLRAGGEGDNRGSNGWMALLTQWTWAWANSGRQWRTGKPGVLHSIGLQRVKQDLATEPKAVLRKHCTIL